VALSLGLSHSLLFLDNRLLLPLEGEVQVELEAHSMEVKAQMGKIASSVQAAPPTTIQLHSMVAQVAPEGISSPPHYQAER
jgi:hypothetical protein